MSASAALRQPEEPERRVHESRSGRVKVPHGDAAAAGVETSGGASDLVATDPLQDIADASERAVIGAMLAPPTLGDLRAAVGGLSPEDFADPRTHWFFGVIARMAADGIRPDMVTLPGYVRQHAIDGPVLLLRHLGSICNEMASAAPVPASLPYYAALVIEQAARRRTDGAGARLRRWSRGAAFDELAATVQTELSAVLAALGRLSKS